MRAEKQIELLEGRRAGLNDTAWMGLARENGAGGRWLTPVAGLRPSFFVLLL